MTGNNVVIVGLPSEGVSALAGGFGFPQSDALPSAPAPESKTLLVYRTPWSFLHDELAQSAPIPTTLDELEAFAMHSLSHWRAYHQTMFSVYRELEASCMLLNGDRYIDLNAVRELLDARFAVRTSPGQDSSGSAAQDERPLHETVFRRAIDVLAPECADLYSELEACAELMGREPEFDTDASERQSILIALQATTFRAKLAKVLEEYGIDAEGIGAVLEGGIRARDELARASSEKARELEATIQTVEKQRQEIERHLGQIEDLKTAIERKTIQAQDLQAQDESNRQALEQLRNESATSQREVEALKQENRLSLLQLHQIQEELEHYFELNRKNEQRIAGLEEEVNGRLVAKVVRSIGGLPKGITAKVGFGKQIARIRASGLFDEKWYLQRYPDVAQSQRDPIEHYVKYGAAEGRNPSARFDTRWYLDAYPDVAQAKLNPLLHYVRFGKNEGRKPHRFAP